MKNLTDFIGESKTTPKQMKEYEISWLKFVSNEKEMKEAIDAIKEGFLAAYEYRTDPQYESDMDRKYVAATKLLKEFIDKLEIKAE